MNAFRAIHRRGFIQSLSAGSMVIFWGRDHIGLQGSVLPRPSYSHSSVAVSCEQDCDHRWVKFKPEYRGQLTPKRSPAVLSNRPSFNIEFQSGPYASRWLRVCYGASADDVVEALSLAKNGAESAVYVGIPDDHERSGPIVASLRARGFKFHHFVEGKKEEYAAPPGELIYYRWCGDGVDMVPSYSTALEGVGVLVLSPEKDAVLLVWEYGHWKMITGNVDACESMVTTVQREVHEEVGVEIEESMSMAGGWQEAASRDKAVNNVFCVFMVTAKSLVHKVDGVEIAEARWFPLAQLPLIEQEANDKGKPYAMEWDLGTPGRNFLSRTVVRFLEVYRQGRGLHVRSNTGSDPLNRRNLFL